MSLGTRRVLLTGAGGFVGARVDFADRAFPRGFLRGASEDDIRAFVAEAAPDVILHTAAMSDVAACEADPDGSYRANVELPVMLARAAAEVGAKLVAFSSDQVYTGLPGTGPFDETVDVHPTCIYGRHKREAEERVLDLLPSAVFLRATWMYDLPSYGLPTRPNFLSNLLFSTLRHRPVSLSVREYRGITYVRDVTARLPAAADLPGGVYNFGSENDKTTYKTAEILCARAGLFCTVLPDMAAPARSLAIDGSKARAAGIDFPKTADGLLCALDDYGIRF